MDPGFFSDGDPPLRNDITDRWAKQISKLTMKKKAYNMAFNFNRICTNENTKEMIQQILHNFEVILESCRSSKGGGGEEISIPCTHLLNPPLTPLLTLGFCPTIYWYIKIVFLSVLKICKGYNLEIHFSLSRSFPLCFTNTYLVWFFLF